MTLLQTTKSVRTNVPTEDDLRAQWLREEIDDDTYKRMSERLRRLTSGLDAEQRKKLFYRDETDSRVL